MLLQDTAILRQKHLRHPQAIHSRAWMAEVLQMLKMIHLHHRPHLQAVQQQMSVIWIQMMTEVLQILPVTRVQAA